MRPPWVDGYDAIGHGTVLRPRSYAASSRPLHEGVETSRTPAQICFVTKLLPSCYPSVTVRLHNECQLIRCPSPFPFPYVTLGAPGFRLYVKVVTL